MTFSKEMQKALEADGEKLRQLTGEDHGPEFWDTCVAESPGDVLIQAEPITLDDLDEMGISTCSGANGEVHSTETRESWLRQLQERSPAKGGPTESDPNRPYCKPDQSCCDFCCGN